jgi:hypothetical protein
MFRERMTPTARDSADHYVEFSGPFSDGEYVLMVSKGYECLALALTKSDVLALRDLLSKGAPLKTPPAGTQS